MKAGKAYISSLGTTGLLIASSVLLLLVVGTIVAFDRWPDNEPAQAEVVAVDGSDRAVPAGSVTAERRGAARVRAAQRRRAAAAKRRGARGRSSAASVIDARWAETISLADPVISDLPAPDSDGSSGQRPGSSGVPGGGSGSGGSGGGGNETTRHLGDAVANVSPQAGTAIGGVGSAVDQAIDGTAPSLGP